MSYLPNSRCLSNSLRLTNGGSGTVCMASGVPSILSLDTHPQRYCNLLLVYSRLAGAIRGTMLEVSVINAVTELYVYMSVLELCAGAVLSAAAREVIVTSGTTARRSIFVNINK